MEKKKLSRKEMKGAAKKVLKKHYWVLVVLCLILAFFNVEFASSLDVIESTSDTEELEQLLSDDGVAEDLDQRYGVSDGTSFYDFIYSAVKKGLPETIQAIQQKEQELRDSSDKRSAFGTTNGVFAGLVDNFSTGHIWVVLLTAITSFSGDGEISLFLMALGFILATTFFLFWIENIMIVVERRFFLEARTYDKLVLGRFNYIIRLRCWWKVVKTMGLCFIYKTLWRLTIIGGVIKEYSYRMVPYIVAENPDMKPNEVITLSRKMMDGHKWECFVLDLSFLGWAILGFITYHVLDIFFVNPYIVATNSEYYAAYRDEAKKLGIKNADKLNDRYLYEKAGDSAIRQVYPDVIEELDKEMPRPAPLKGIPGILANWFGIILRLTPEEKAFEEAELHEQKYRSLAEEVRGEVYPARLFPVPVKKRRKTGSNVSYNRHYTISSLVAMYFIFAMVGWIWEVTLHFITHHEFANRGTLHGPWLPIYGTGALIVLIVLYRARSKPWLLTILTVVLCGVLEYFSGWYCEVFKGRSYWNYQGYFLNLHGRICAEGLLVFALAGVAVTYALGPYLDDLIRKIPLKVIVPILTVLVLCFIGDQIYTSFYPNLNTGETGNNADRDKDSSGAPAAAAAFAETAGAPIFMDVGL